MTDPKREEALRELGDAMKKYGFTEKDCSPEVRAALERRNSGGALVDSQTASEMQEAIEAGEVSGVVAWARNEPPRWTVRHVAIGALKLLALLFVLFALLVVSSVAAEAQDVDADLPYVEGWLKRSQSFHEVFGEYVRSEQWQGSIFGRVPLGDRFDAVARFDTMPQSGRFTLTDFSVWQSLEAYVGLTGRAGTIAERVEFGGGLLGGYIFETETLSKGRQVDASRPSFAFGGAYLRDSASRAYLYVGFGFHEPTNEKRLAVILSFHLPLFSKVTSLDVDFVTGRAYRLVVSLGARVFAF